ncbi:MAG: glutamine-hydrolyzing GMP synthase subunit GuaA [Candidatus Diapherotrites archaeon]|nr:glutamine-hydrolyzing GMP synthase subunit GuaA [Candidatus Diapherotrites archaeon]
MFDVKKWIAEEEDWIRGAVTGEAVIATSGGVDSTVAAVLAHKALGRKLHCIYVNTGYMRKGEDEHVRELFKGLEMEVEVVDAGKRFYDALKGVTDPEEKRKIIGELFIRVFEERAKQTGAKFLVQGTIAPDWIESGAGIRDNIKSHHNVGGLPEKHGFKLIEPLRELYKDEVRKVGKELGIAEEVYNRQPFPGPGLAVRIMGEATPDKVKILQEAVHIAEEEIERAARRGECEIPWQYFAVLLPTKTVGVLGDKRAYGYTIGVRAVQSIDGMTAKYSEIPHSVLARISNRITRELKDHVNRVVYDITSKPPGTIEWE